MKVLLDTDVLLDVAMQRAPHHVDSGRLLDALGAEGGAFVAWHSLTNVAYLLKPHATAGEIRSFLEGLLVFARLARTDDDDARRALSLPFTDIEDAFQAAAALACGADVIATRNVRDYRGSPVKAEHPGDVLKRFVR